MKSPVIFYASYEGATKLGQFSSSWLVFKALPENVPGGEQLRDELNSEHAVSRIHELLDCAHGPAIRKLKITIEEVRT